MNAAVLMRELAAAVDAPVLDGAAVAPYLLDATEARGLRGRADAVVLPRTADDVAAVLAWCYEHDVPIVPRGGGTRLRGRRGPRRRRRARARAAAVACARSSRCCGGPTSRPA